MKDEKLRYVNNGNMFICHSNSNLTVDAITEISDMICNFIASCYLSLMPSYTVPLGYLDEPASEKDLDYIMSNIDKCGTGMWRIKSDVESIYIKMYDKSDDDSIAILISTFNPECLNWVLIVRNGTIETLTPTPYIYSMGNHKDTKKFLKDLHGKQTEIGMVVLTYLKKCIMVILGHDNTQIELLDSHTDLEFKVTRKILNTVMKENNGITSMVDVYGERVTDLHSIMDMNLIEYHETLDRGFPTLTINNREWDAIVEYVASSRLFNEHGLLNIKEIIEHQRYGRKLSMNLDTGEHVNFDAIIKDDQLLILMSYDIDRYRTLFISIEYNNLESFDICNDIQSIRLDIWHKDSKVLESSISDIMECLPEIFHDQRQLILLARRLLEVYIIIYDRPTRGQYDPSTLNDKKDEEANDVIIRRILGPMKFENKSSSNKTSSSTSNTSTKSSSNRAAANYVVEYWEREGHERTVKGKTVWIPSTTCHRLLPLTDKEVLIKL